MEKCWPRIRLIGYGEEWKENALRTAINIRFATHQKYQSLNFGSLPCVEIALSPNRKKEMQKAVKDNMTHVVFLEPENESSVKDLKTREQKLMKTSHLGDYFAKLMEENGYGSSASTF